MLQLNDFSGGLNTKSSPRDINVNQLTKADNAIVSKAGLIQSSKDAEDKSGNVSGATQSDLGGNKGIDLTL